MLRLLLVSALTLQQPAAPPPAPSLDSGQALRVYLDCALCDFDYFRTQITYVDWVRDHHDAQVDILVSTQGTGSGGTEYTVELIGQMDNEGETDTLRWDAPPAASDQQVREGLVHTVKLGLVRFVARTPLAARLDVSMLAPPPGGPGGAAGGRHPHDPWNYWVFRVSTTGSLSAEAAYRSYSIYTTLSANRVTDRWKVSLSVNQNNSESRSQITDTSWYVSDSHSDGFSGLVVRSLGGHWSAGLQAGANSSTYYNRDWQVSAGPAIEYDIWPYSESTRRLLRINYSVSAEHDDYHDLTVYGVTVETLAKHALEADLTSVRRWGSINASVTGTQYLKDLRLYDVGAYGGLTLNLVKGLSFSASVFYSYIRDQLYLPAVGATQQEILVRQIQLPTTYSVSTYFGLSYTFGSIFNNIVNPRFGNAGGGPTMIISF